MSDYINLYTRAYMLLETRTPMMFDCGALCSSVCCNENGLGMLLFPYEEEYLAKTNNDFIITDSNIEIQGYKVKLLRCNGTCDRHTRPLACRIFPLFPFTGETGGISVEFDPRAYGTCPLLLTDIEGIYTRGLFRLMVLKTAHMISHDPMINSFLVNMTKELKTIKLFRP